MEIVRDIVENANSISFMIAYFGLAAEWHYECHEPIKAIRKGSGNCNSEYRNKIE
jgi:hypothetical protein